MDRVTIVEGSAFLICAPDGDVSPVSAEGFFFRDTRFLSRWSLQVNGQPLEALARDVPEPYCATFVARALPQSGRADSNLMVERRRYVGRGMREDVLVRNFGEEPTYCAVELAYGADFADLFAVKEARVVAGGDRDVVHEDGALVFRHKNGSRLRSLRVAFSRPAVLDGNVARWEVIIPSKGAWTLCEQFTCGIDDDEIEPRWLCGQSDRQGQAGRAHGRLAAQRAGARHRPRGPADGGGP